MKATNGIDVTSVLSCLLDGCAGESVALRAGDQSMDYDTLSDASHYLADVLGEAGVQGGSRVGLLVTGNVRSVIALCALGRLAATVVMLDPAAPTRHLAARIREADVELLVADTFADDVLEDMVDELDCGDLPIAVTQDYALAEVAPTRRGPDRAPELVFFDDEARSSSLSWNEVLDPSAALRSVAMDGSTVALAESLLRARSVAALFAAFGAGADVVLTGELGESTDSFVFAARLCEHGVSVVVGGPQRIEELVRCGGIGLLPTPSLVRLVVLDGALTDMTTSALCESLPAASVRYAETRTREPAA